MFYTGVVQSYIGTYKAMTYGFVIHQGVRITSNSLHTLSVHFVYGFVHNSVFHKYYAETKEL